MRLLEEGAGGRLQAEPGAVPVLILLSSVAMTLGKGGEGTDKGTCQVWTSIITEKGNCL